MATRTSSPAPAPANGDKVKAWSPPSSDQEFVFSTVAEAPAWVDKNWASFDRGPALAVPAGDPYGSGPYTTKTARPGDTVKYTVAKGAQPAQFTIIPGDPAPEDSTPKPPQQSGAALEDLIKQGYLAPDDLGSDAKAQVAGRTPALKPMFEEQPDGGKVAPPEKQTFEGQLITE